MVLGLGRSLGLGWAGLGVWELLSLPSVPGGPARPCVLTPPHLHLLLAHPLPPVPRQRPLRGAGTSEGRAKAKCRGWVCGLWSQSPGLRTQLSLGGASLSWEQSFDHSELQFPGDTTSSPWPALSPEPGRGRLGPGWGSHEGP